MNTKTIRQLLQGLVPNNQTIYNNLYKHSRTFKIECIAGSNHDAVRGILLQAGATEVKFVRKSSMHGARSFCLARFPVCANQ